MYNIDTKEQYNYNLEQNLYYLNKLEPIELSTLPRQLNLEFKEKNKIQLPANLELAELYENGLQCSSSRHIATQKLAFYFMRKNFPPDTVKQLLKRWIRNKNNGFSKEVNRCNFKLVDNEIDKQVNWCNEILISSEQYPDATHNSEKFICKEDLLLIKQIVTDYTNRRRLFKFLAYCRPRLNYDRIFISRWKWREFTGDTHEDINFKQLLIEKNIITINNSYRVAEYPKSIKLNLKLNGNNKIENDNRAVQDYDSAVLNIVKNLTEYQELTNASRAQYFLKLHDFKKIV